MDLTSGALDTTFTQSNSGFDNGVLALAINSSNNSLYVGGNFTSYRGVANNAQYLAKLDLTSGNLDTVFTQNSSGFNNRVEFLGISTIQNYLYVAGQFGYYRNTYFTKFFTPVDLNTGDPK